MKRLLLTAALLCAASPAWPRAGGGGGGGGCFPAGTPILTVEGEVPIEDIRAGDRVLAFSNERLVQVEVKNFIKKKDRLVKLRTAKGTLTATLEHPLLTRYGFTEVRDIKKGDTLAVLRDGRRVWTKVRSIRTAGVAEVFNLEVAPPHTFVANGFIVHNKGGSFGGGYRSSSYSRYGRRRSNGLLDFIIYIPLLLFVLYNKFFKSKAYGQKSGGGSSHISGGSVTSRARETREIMESVSRRDPDFNPSSLDTLVRDIFIRVQAAWQARDYSSLGAIMMPSMRASHGAKVEAMKDRGEVNMMEDVQVRSVDFVQVLCPAEKAARSFTALISASARDYTIDASSGSLISGSRGESSFQEFWTFQQLNGAWALARIDQVGEFDFLNSRNLPDSPQGGQPFPGLAAASAAAAPGLSAAATAVPIAADPAFQALTLGGAAPAVPPGPEPGLQPHIPAQLPRAEAKKASGSGQWDRQKMEIAATLAFESVYTAWGSNDAALLKPDFVSAEALAKLKRVIEGRKAEGLIFEFSNLFTRRAEVVLTSPAAKSPLRLDEFTARINATAVRAMLRNGKTLHRDPAPAAFTEYWVFGRQNESWKLRDILPRMDQERDSDKDGAPTPVQIEWYWGSTASL